MAEPDSYKKWELWIKILTLVVIVVGGVWGYLEYTDTKEKEFYSDFWNRKMELFLRTTNAASEMATTSSAETFNEARTEYWELFYGPLSLVEGPCVKRSMEVFSRCVPKDPIDSSITLPMQTLKQPSYRLALRLKQELAKAWRKPFSELELSELPPECDFDDEVGCR